MFYPDRSTRNLFLIPLIALAIPAFPQTQTINGTIRGHVTDQSGTPVSQATITVENAQTGFYRSIDGNGDGYYVFPNLPLGSYTVTIPLLSG
jgi:hypothetical protein